jgi:hypothetical protein
MRVHAAACDPDCEFQSLTSSAVDLAPNLQAS